MLNFLQFFCIYWQLSPNTGTILTKGRLALSGPFTRVYSAKATQIQDAALQQRLHSNPSPPACGPVHWTGPFFWGHRARPAGLMGRDRCAHESILICARACFLTDERGRGVGAKQTLFAQIGPIHAGIAPRELPVHFRGVFCAEDLW
jgi:hypothetical protein